MTEQNLGSHYDAVVEAWTRLEVASRYEAGPTKLPRPGRPDPVTNWINGAQGKRPALTAVTKPSEYEVIWHAWWSTLQPSWRKLETDGTWSVAGGYGADGKEWGPLYQWGVNGTLSIVASLYFWGCAVQEDYTQRLAWEAAVLDVSWMLEGMACYYEKFYRKF